MNLQIFTRWQKIGNCSKFSLKYLEPSKTQLQPAGLDMSPSFHICLALFFPSVISIFADLPKVGQLPWRMHFCFFFHMKLGLHFCLLEAPLSRHGFSRRKQYLYWTHSNIQRPVYRWSRKRPYNNVLQYWSLLSPCSVSHICPQQCEDKPKCCKPIVCCKSLSGSRGFIGRFYAAVINATTSAWFTEEVCVLFAEKVKWIKRKLANS